MHSYISISQKPCNRSSGIVRCTCSMQGEKQLMRVARSLRRVSFAWLMASHGEGRSRKTGGQGRARAQKNTRVGNACKSKAVAAHVAAAGKDRV